MTVSRGEHLIFLVSLPRSGSTLLQKMLTISPDVHSVSEPWLFLPFAYMLQKEGIRTLYSHKTFFYAIEDLIGQLPNGVQDFYSALGDFVTTLYWKTQTGKDARYFLDKTPRYYLILPFLAEAFPDAKFIFLFRNPLEVLCSVMKTWHKNRVLFYSNYIDIYHGPQALAKGYSQLQDRALAVQYPDLVKSPAAELRKICEYLGIAYQEEMVRDYKQVELAGRMGDPKGVHKFENVSTDPLSKWKKVLNNRYRKWYAKRYVRYLGNSVLRSFNLSVKELTEEIDSITELKGGSFSDAYDHLKLTFMRLVDIEHVNGVRGARRRKKKFLPYI